MERFVETAVTIGLIPGFLFGYRVYETQEHDLGNTALPEDYMEGSCISHEDHVLYIGFIDICVTIKKYELWP